MGQTMVDANAIDAKWHRWGFLGGVVFVILNIVGIIAGGSPPGLDAKAEELTKYMNDHHGGVRLGAVLFGFSLLFIVWWLGSFWRVISSLEPNGPRLSVIVVTSTMLILAFAGLANVLLSTVAIRNATLGGVSEFVWAASNVAIALMLAASAVWLLAVGALVMRTKFLPVWMGWLAGVVAIASSIGTLAAGSAKNSLLVFMFIGFLGWMLWILIASVLLYMGKKA